MTIRGTLCICATTAVFVCAAVSPGATVTWPNNNQWTPLEVGGSLYADKVTVGGNPFGDVYDTPPNPEYTDIVGGIDSQGNGPFAAGFWYKDATHLMFRIRVDNEPSKNPQVVWQALLDSDSDSDVEWALQLDLSSKDDQVELVPAISGGPDNSWDVVLAAPPHTGAGTPPTDFYRFVNATAGGLDAPYGGSNFDSLNDDDYFVDFAFGLIDFEDLTGLDAGTFDFTNRTALTTSTTHTQTNKDLPDFTSRDDSETAPASFPEPVTMGMLTLAFAALGGYICKRRRSASLR